MEVKVASSFIFTEGGVETDIFGGCGYSWLGSIDALPDSDSAKMLDKHPGLRLACNTSTALLLTVQPPTVNTTNPLAIASYTGDPSPDFLHVHIAFCESPCQPRLWQRYLVRCVFLLRSMRIAPAPLPRLRDALEGRTSLPMTATTASFPHRQPFELSPKPRYTTTTATNTKYMPASRQQHRQRRTWVLGSPKLRKDLRLGAKRSSNGDGLVLSRSR